MGIYESKFVVLKHFRCDVSAKESSAPFLITIYTLKNVFCKDNSLNSVEYAFDRCVEFLSGNTAADDRNTHWKHVLKVHCVHRPWRKLRGGICRCKTFFLRIFARRTLLRFRYCSVHIKMCVLLTYSARN